jgi:hypothetical protein
MDGPITADGLRQLTLSASATRTLDEKIAASLGATPADDAYFCQALATQLSWLPEFPTTLATLDAALLAEAARVEALARALMQPPPTVIARGTAVHLFSQLWAGTRLDDASLVAWLGRYEHAARLRTAIASLAMALPSAPKKALAIEEHVGL